MKMNRELKELKNEKKNLMQNALNIALNAQKKIKLNFENNIFIINDNVDFCDLLL